MKRWLLNLVTAVSLLLFVAVVALWVRSYWHADEWSLMRGKRYFLWSEKGRVVAGVETQYVTQGADWPETLALSPGNALLPTAYSPRWALSGQRGRTSLPHESFDQTVMETMVAQGGQVELRQATVWIAPHAALAAIAILPAAARGVAWLVAFVRFCRRVAGNACPGCGYDLRATPGRCPECGRAAPAARPT